MFAELSVRPMAAIGTGGPVQVGSSRARICHDGGMSDRTTPRNPPGSPGATLGVGSGFDGSGLVGSGFGGSGFGGSGLDGSVVAGSAVDGPVPEAADPGTSAAGRGPGVELSAARAALVALIAAAALAFAAARTVELLVVVAIVQAAFVVTWVLGAAVAVVPGESFDGPDTEVEIGPTPSLVGGAPSVPTPTPTLDAGMDAVMDDDNSVPAAGAMPGRIGAVLIGGAATAAADVAVSHWPHSQLSPLLGILGLAVPAMFAHQLIRGVVRARVVESLSGIAMIIVAVIALPSLLQLRHELGGGHMVAAAALSSGVAVAVGLLVDLVWSRPRFDPDVPRGLTGVVLGTAAGAAVGVYLVRHLSQFSTERAVLYCAGIAAASALVGVATSLISYSSPLTGPVARPARLLRPVALALLPIMLVAPGAYVLFLNA